MKKYKLKKNIKYSKANCIFEYEESVRLSGENVTLGNCYEINQLIDLFGIDNQEYFEEVIDKPKTLKDLKEGDKVYFINEEKVDYYIYNSIVVQFNYEDYLTYEQAERELKFRIAKRKIEDWIILNDDGVIDWENENNKKYYIYYNCASSKLDSNCIFAKKFSLFYSSSREIAEKAIKELETELVYILKDY